MEQPKSEITIWIRSVSENERGGIAQIALTITDGAHLSDETYSVMKVFFGDFPVQSSAIDEETYEHLVFADECSRAAIKAADLLNASDHTRKQLRDKLRKRSFSPEACEAAVKYLDSRGVIREEDYMERCMRFMCDKKCWGPNKINMELNKRGFSRREYGQRYEAIMAELDFIAGCKKRIEKCGVSVFDDPQKRQKYYSALLRQGFYGCQIKEALVQCKKEEELKNKG